jgi:hypothetical protein
MWMTALAEIVGRFETTATIDGVLTTVGRGHSQVPVRKARGTTAGTDGGSAK